MRTSLRLAVSLLALSGVAHADSVLVVSHQMQSAWHGYAVFVDGQLRTNADGNAKRIGKILPGRHELGLNIVSNPFSQGKRLCTGPVDVPDQSEVRIKCEDNGTFTIIGITSFAPPPPPPPVVVVAPPPPVRDARSDADEFLAMAAREMSEAPPACNRLRQTVYDLRFDLASRMRGGGGRHRLAFETNALADQARDVCQPSTVQLLRDASRTLMPYESAPPPMRPVPVNPDQASGMRDTIAMAPAPRDRLIAMRRVTRGSWFTTRQIGPILDLFFPPMRMEVLRELAPRLVDPQVMGPVLERFPMPADRNEASAILSR